MVYTLDAGDLDAINRHFGLAFDPGGRVTRLAKWTSIREPPYLVHTGFELVLMIEGRKPFARMGDSYPPHQHYDEDLFDRYVALGILHKEVQLEPFAEPVRYPDGRILEGLRTVYYTLKGEEWRIPAWKLVSEASRKSGWNDHLRAPRRHAARLRRMAERLVGRATSSPQSSTLRERCSLHLAVTAKMNLPPIDECGPSRTSRRRSEPLRLLSRVVGAESEDAERFSGLMAGRQDWLLSCVSA